MAAPGGRGGPPGAAGKSGNNIAKDYGPSILMPQIPQKTEARLRDPENNELEKKKEKEAMDGGVRFSICRTPA
ncbi:hypothetical protein [Streptosporangium lutulentum]|uniref:Uncharacterized protein n=1 Tax=Streptosporangium lutulentum TaxID=1461250 RepID=A0ABT9QNY2_9ACTN|nr:hypothetical protein [Streptosporangium lutulentum]MDP9848458.1 hypothetical protein [Streptosporangium lutulentum]